MGFSLQNISRRNASLKRVLGCANFFTKLCTVVLLIVTLVSNTYAQQDSFGDIAVISAGATNHSYFTYGPGTVTERWPARVGENHNTAYLAGDFGGDGSDDIACIDFDANDDARTVVLNSPGKSNADRAVWANAMRSSDELTFYFLPGDFDGDGNFDLAALYLQFTGDDNDVFAKITYGPDGVRQSINAEDWLFENSRDSAFVSGYFVGDDATSDVGVISRNGADFIVSFYQGADGSEAVGSEWDIITPTVTDSPIAFRSGDFNGDGNTDIATAFYNSADTTYSARIVFGTDGATSQLWDLGNTPLDAILVEDFNGDGFTDIAAVTDDNGDRTAAIHLGSAAGTVAAVQNWTIESDVANITQYLAGKFARTTYTVSGTVYQVGGVKGLAYATVSLGGSLVATTDLNGTFTISGVNSGDYTAIVSKSGGYLFTPATRDITVSESDITGIEFTATNAPAVYSITGRVYQLDGVTGLAKTTVSTDVGHTALTDANGNYRFDNLPNGDYIVTPTKSAHMFDPATRLVIVNGIDSLSNDFRATVNPSIYTLSGRIYRDDRTTGLDGVLVSAGTGYSVMSGEDGVFQIPNMPSGNYTVTASKMGFTFGPASAAVTINGDDLSGSEFFALTEPSVKVKGHVAVGGDGGVQGVIVEMGPYSTRTNATGHYELSGVRYGSYTLTARLSGYQIAPSTFANPVRVMASDLLGYNFNSNCGKTHTQVGNVCMREGTPPGSPTGLRASDGTSDDYVTVSWNVAENATSYQLYRSRHLNELGIALGDPVTSTTLTDRAAVPGVKYYYAVQALNDVGPGGYSNQDRGYRVTNDIEEDCDGDGVSDNQEELDGTAICDEGSYQLHLESPVFAGYNTFLNQFTFVELAANGPEAVEAQITIFNNQGAEITKTDVRIEPYTQMDINVTEFVGQTDTYGTIRIDYNDDSDTVRLSGRIAHYSQNPDGESFAFAYSRELRNANRGESYVTANSIDPTGTGHRVFNWAEITNIEQVPQHFTYRLFNQQGQQVGETATIDLAPFARFDIQAGHEHGEGVYIAEIIPHEGSRRYLAGVSRYGNKIDINSFDRNYTFAYPVDARAGSGDKQYAIITNDAQGCWSQTNWVEIGNTRTKNIVATLTFRDQAGVILGTTEVGLAAKSIQHVNASGMLPIGAAGSVEINPSDSGAIIAESVVYYHDCEENEIQTAFSTPSRRPGYAQQMGSYNSFVRSENLLRVLNVGSVKQNVNINVSNTEAVGDTQTFSIEPKNLLQLYLNQDPAWLIPENSYGTIRLEVSDQNNIIGENLRMKESGDGRMDFVVPSTIR